MIVKFLLDKKRQGHALGSAEIRSLVEGFTKGEIPDYQMSAFAMAVCCRGMTERETADLTESMMRSGACLEWADTIFPTADKHSTGGVGDNLSLIVQPLAASCGIAVPSLAGRSLGITGGTVDKLESIPGYSCSLTLDKFRKMVLDNGVSITAQTSEICPADRKLYALRDVTGTVASIPLITASILSKKLAEGAQSLVFDVKCGKGAFMKTPEEAHNLAVSLVSGAKAAGRKALALVTRMDFPLGRFVGNANEVFGAIEILKGQASNTPAALEVVELCIELAASMVSLAKGVSIEEAREECRKKLADGSAFAKFKAMVEAHGGDLELFERHLERPKFKFTIQAMKSGYVSSIDAEKVGRVALSLGAGREQPSDKIDPLAGVTLAVEQGQRVVTGSPLATLEKSHSPDGLESAAAELFKAFRIDSAAPVLEPLIIERVQ